MRSSLRQIGKDILSPIYYRYHEYLANKTINRKVGQRFQLDFFDHIVIVVVDALRPDYVPDLPMEFTNAIAPGTWTFSTVTSLHTGLTPAAHG